MFFHHIILKEGKRKNKKHNQHFGKILKLNVTKIFQNFTIGRIRIQFLIEPGKFREQISFINFQNKNI